MPGNFRKVNTFLQSFFIFIAAAIAQPAGNTIQYRYQTDGARLYLEEIRYSIFSMRFQYEARPDVLRTGRSGFLRVTAQRAATIELHCERLAPTLMRTYRLSYQQGAKFAHENAG